MVSCSMDELSLYKICIRRTAAFILKGYWLDRKMKEVVQLADSRKCVADGYYVDNKFRSLPSTVGSGRGRPSKRIRHFQDSIFDFEVAKMTLGPVYCGLPSATIPKASADLTKLLVHVPSSDIRNPFSDLPSSIIDDLLIKICYSWRKLSDFFLLITSGRVEHLNLSIPNFYACHVYYILQLISSLPDRCLTLKSIIINSLLELPLPPHYVTGRNGPNTRSQTAANSVTRMRPLSDLGKTLSGIISSSPHLEFLESNIRFELKALRKCPRLKCLKINFIFPESFSDLLKNKNGSFSSNSSLQTLTVHGLPKLKTSQSGIPLLLKYCHALTEVYQLDVSDALKELDAENCRTLTKQCNLRICFIGWGTWKRIQLWDRSIFILRTAMQCVLPENSNQHIIDVIARTCPAIEELYIITNNCDFSSLSSLSHLQSLNIVWGEKGNDFKSVSSFFENVNENLKCLSLAYVYDVDLAVFGKSCPNLEVLCLWYYTVRNAAAISSTFYRNLKYLLYCNEAQINTGGDALLHLLSSCSDLIVLIVLSAEYLNDETLKQILRKNSLSKLQRILLGDCNLTEEGVKFLVDHLESLTEIFIISYLVTISTVKKIVEESNRPITFAYYDAHYLCSVGWFPDV